MARRGLVSKSMTPQGGGAALMPKGDKPKGPELIPYAEVARRLRVDPSQVESWISKDQLRGGDDGVRPYDFKKFQLDNRDEIARAQRETQEGGRSGSKRKPKKGILSKFRSIFGGDEKESTSTNSGAGLVQENQKLRAELKKFKSKKPSEETDGAGELEEKVRYLEGKLSENRALESEVSRLKKQLAEGPGDLASSSASSKEMSQQLEQAKRQLAEAHKLHDALAQAQREKDELKRSLENLQAEAGGSAEVTQLKATLQEREESLLEMEKRAREITDENEQLRQEQTSHESKPTIDDSLSEQLLQLQKVNLQRFKSLDKLHQDTLNKMEVLKNTSSEGDPEQARAFRVLKKKYQTLLEESSSKNAANQDVIEQLAAIRAITDKLEKENEELKSQLTLPSEGSEQRILELEAKLSDAQSKGEVPKKIETELQALRKEVRAKENQVQKIANRLEDNEKRLSKTLQESARLTELLIERENRLRELSTEYEQEYRDKMENLDRQVSGLQWKLSLREERIAQLERENSSLRGE